MEAAATRPGDSGSAADGSAVGNSGATGAAGATGDSGAEVARLVASRVLDVPDFPQPGIMFKDLTPLFADGEAFRSVVDTICDRYGRDGFDVVVGIEARGFVIAAAVAYATGLGVVPVRKAGKLPRSVLSAAYDLEYGQAVLEVHEDAFQPGQRVLVVDDVLATGGTAAAALDLVERAGGVVAGFTVLMELSFLAGRERLAGRPVHALQVV
jgi:adenine phosphoribosyltransferase